MIHTLQNKSVGGADRLVDNVYAIIDSRIQYLEYQKETLVKNCLNGKTHSEPSKDSSPLTSKGLDNLLSSYEQMQEKISSMSHSVRLLLFIRSHLIRHNAQIVLGLLTDCAYLEYSKDRLYHILWSSRTIN